MTDVRAGDELREIRDDFFSEADEGLDAVEQDLIRLEAMPVPGNEAGRETVDRLFRTLHTLKGSAGFLGLEKIAGVAHSGETLLGEVRDGRVEIDKPVVDSLLQAADVLKDLLRLNKAGQGDEGVEVDDVQAVLEALAGGGEEEIEGEPVAEEVAGVAEEEDASPVVVEALQDPQLDEGIEAVQPVVEVAAPGGWEGKERRKQGRRGDDDVPGTLRVEVGKLDALVNMAGELTLARNALMQRLRLPEVMAALARSGYGEDIDATAQRLSQVTQELQHGVMAARMQPLGKIFEKIPRLVRDLKNQLGKDVALLVEGDSVEADKTLVEELADPLMHLVRNALDHGIELPRARKLLGKHAQGTVTVRAFYEGKTVVIEVRDDGAGMDPAQLRAEAVKRGVCSEAEAAALDDAEAFWLATRPGFTTRREADAISGRGVGLDVVAAKVEGLRGRLEIYSEKGVGTCFTLRLPLTLAIVNALLVADREEGYAIPLRDIAEVVRLRKDSVRHVNGQAVMDLRGEAVALRRLAGLESGPTEEPTGGYVVVVRGAQQAVGLIVDSLLGQEDMVVKPLSPLAGGGKAVAGATVAGDGTVHMILDIPSLLKSKGFTGGTVAGTGH